ncbi:MAG: hypothetical protein AAFY26_10550 [Cyanobacteria bacterium J06638_22]
MVSKSAIVCFSVAISWVLSEVALDAALALAAVLLDLDCAVDLARPLVAAALVVLEVAVLRLAVVRLAVLRLAVDALADEDLVDLLAVDVEVLALAGDRRVVAFPVVFPFAAFDFASEPDAGFVAFAFVFFADSGASDASLDP